MSGTVRNKPKLRYRYHTSKKRNLLLFISLVAEYESLSRGAGKMWCIDTVKIKNIRNYYHKFLPRWYYNITWDIE